MLGPHQSQHPKNESPKLNSFSFSVFIQFIKAIVSIHFIIVIFIGITAEMERLSSRMFIFHSFSLIRKAFSMAEYKLILSFILITQFLCREKEGEGKSEVRFQFLNCVNTCDCWLFSLPISIPRASTISRCEIELDVSDYAKEDQRVEGRKFVASL